MPDERPKGTGIEKHVAVYCSQERELGEGELEAPGSWEWFSVPLTADAQLRADYKWQTLAKDKIDPLQS